MKKFLSLVLALVMTMSLVTMAGAKDFTDKADIDHAEAVEVMEAVKVITGYTDGSFRPDTLLNRGQAAKIICNLILGPTEAAALSTASAPFSDVPANHTFAGYIAYCASEGIINGYTDGTFRPTNTLNGYAFMKMLLGVLGYDGAIENYSGANWSINVAKQALAIDLDAGIKGFSGAQAISRQVACQMALNALEANYVEYADKGANITIGGVVINTGASEAVERSAYYLELFDGDLDYTTGLDLTGRPSITWTYDGDKVGTFADKPVATYTKAVKEKAVYVDAGIDKTTAYTFSKTVNGKLTQTTGTQTITKNANVTVPGTGDGIVTEFYLNKAENAGYMVQVHPVIGKITSVSKNADGDRIVYVDGKTFKTEKFAKNDWVIYTTKNDSGIVIADMVLAEKKTGEVTLLKGSDEVYIDGVKYIKSDSEGASLAAVGVEDVVDFYLDAQGNLLKLAVSAANVNLDNIAYVEKADVSTDTFSTTYKANLRYADGSKKTVETDVNYYGTYENGIATFKLDSDEKVVLADNTAFYKGTTAIAKGVPTIASLTNAEGTGTKVVTSNTQYVYVLTNGAKTEVKSYTGYKNAPSISTANVAAYMKDGKAVLVYVYGLKSNLTATASDLTYVVKNGDAKVINDGDSTLYYELPVIANGTIGTAKIAASEWDAKVAADEVTAWDSLSVASDDVATLPASQNAQSTAISTEVKAADAETITIDGTTKAWADDVKVFFVDADLNVRAGDISDIYEGTVGTNNYDSYAGGVYTVDTTDAHIIECIVLCEK